MSRRLASLPARIVFSLMIIQAFVYVTYGYNKSWDQGHLCVDPNGGNEGWGRYDYDGVFQGGYTSKECCELLCKICPVYAKTGQLQKTVTDLSVPGVGPSLRIVRTYLSQEWSTSLLGRGWVFNFGKRLIVTRNKEGERVLGVRQQTGEKNFFLEQPDGSLELLAGYGVTYELVKNPDGTYAIYNRNGSMQTLNVDGKITSIVDKNGNTLLFEYDTHGCLTRITNAVGHYVDFQLGPNGKIADISDSFGRTVLYDYDENGNLTTVTDPLGYTTSYVYDGRNRLTQINNAYDETVFAVTYDNHQPPRIATFTEKGETWTIAYYSDHTVKSDSSRSSWTYSFNDLGILEETIDPLGNVTQQQHNGITSTSLDWREDANGNRTTFTYDGEGNVAGVTDPLGHTTAYTYVPGTNWRETETNPLGVVTEYVYDANGNQIALIRDSGGDLENTTSFTYDGAGNRTGVTDPLGHTTTYTYDAAGNLTSVTDPLGNTTSYTYDERGNQLTETDANGNTMTYTYDLIGHVLSITNPLGNVITYSYDADGNLSSIQYPDSTATTFAYDAYHHITHMTDALGNTTTYTYDSHDSLTTTTDANGNTTTYVYDALGRRVQIIDALGNVTESAYDAAGNLVAAIDARGNTTTYAYDANRRLIQKELPDGAAFLYGYDSIGNRISETAPTGRSITMTYDELNRKTSKSYADGSTVAYTYDPLDRMLTCFTPTISHSYEYDALGRMVMNTSGQMTLRYVYDSVGNRLSLTTPEGLTIEYTHDATNRICTVGLSNGPSLTYTYDSLNRIVRTDSSEGFYSIRVYDAAGRLQEFEHWQSSSDLLYSQEHVLDNIGNILSKITTFAFTSYTYDELDRLVSAMSSSQPMELFVYDSVGNRVSSADHSPWVYNNRNQLVSFDGHAFAYGPNGNMISRQNPNGLTEYSYDDENRLLEVVRPDGSRVVYSYDGMDRRLTKDVDGVRRRYLYDGGFLLAEYNGDGDLIRNYLNGAGGDFNPSLILESGTVYVVGHDHLNTPKIVVDSSGELVWSADHHSFGAAIISVEQLALGFRFPGQYFDVESYLHYNWKRYYDSDLGRYLTEDPDSTVYKPNLYAYADSNPVRKSDPMGLRVQVCIKPLSIPPWVDAMGYILEPLWWPIFRMHAKHCNVRITSPGYSNWGFFANAFDGPGWVTENPTPIGACRDAIGVGNNEDCWDKCVNDAASSGGNTHYNFPYHNCCHWAREMVAGCGLSNPYPNVNWPFNPGP